MSRLLLRFLVVLALGLAVVYVAGTGDTGGGPRESPTLATGPLGDMGTRVPGPAGRGGVQLTPIRDVVITLLETAADGTGEAWPVGELRGSRAEFRTPEHQRIADAVAVYALRGAADPGAPGRRSVFDAVLHHRPLSEDDAARARAAAREERPPTALAYVRIEAAEAVIETRPGARQVQFLGGPPDGVAITLFEADGTAVLEVRTERLLCTYPELPVPDRLLITSDKLVRLYTPDRLYRLEGEGFWALLESAPRAAGPPSDRSGKTTEPQHGRFELLRRIHFEAAEGFRRDRAADSRQIRRERTTVTADGPAVLELRQFRTATDRKRMAVDTFELHRAVRIVARSHLEDPDHDLVEDLETDLAAEFLRLWIGADAFEAAEAVGDVRLRSVLRRTRAENPPHVLENTTVATGERARLEYAGQHPHRVEILAWSARPVPTGLLLAGPSHVAIPVHRPPHVAGAFRDPDTEHLNFSARCDGNLVVENLDRDPAIRHARLILERNVHIDLDALQRAPERHAGPGEPAAFTPASSSLFARDRFVLTHHGEPACRAEFAARGAVRTETLFGRLEADAVDGWLGDRDRWRIEANGRPCLDLPLASRSAPEVARALEAFALTPAGPAARPAEASGRLTVEGQRAVLEAHPPPDGAARGAGGASARFTGAVRLTQTELTAEPIVLSCEDLRFALSAARSAAGPQLEPGSFAAEGDVVLEAGTSIRASGDRLTVAVAAPPADAGKAARAGRLRLEGFPASVSAAPHTGDAVRLEGRTIDYDGLTRTATARTGVLAVLVPAKGDFVLPAAAPRATVLLRAIELEAEEATAQWDEHNVVRGFRAAQAVRIRGFDRPAGRAAGTAAPSPRLVQWAEGDELVFEVLDDDAAGPASMRRLVLRGSVEQPVRAACRNPALPEEDDLLLVVPVLVLAGPSAPPELTEVRGYGAGSVAYRSQDNVFSSSTRSGPRRDRSLHARFERGFVLRRLAPESFRLDLLDGGEVESFDADGKLEAWLKASEALGLVLQTTAKEHDEDLAAVERGYARGDVRFRYGEDAQGGGDELFWERGTSLLTLAGSPAWGQRAGEPRQEFDRMTYNRATRRFDVYRGAGRLQQRFERKEQP
ncbi:MAG: hypothetical protein JXQ29_17695 [Planctomycetes bacterium]|nr:hypothetical protein [Planctomycetota bacterium]